MRQRCIAVAAVLFFLQTHVSQAQGSGVGLGVMIGEPTGISAKGWLTENTAIDAGLAWAFARRGSMHIHADYLWHLWDVFRTAEKIPIHVGVGGRIQFAAKSRLGVRFVGGVNYHVPTVPIEIFFELAPIVDLVPATDFSLNGGLGARYYFP